MKRFLTFIGLAVLLAGLALPIPSVAAGKTPSSQTYTVLVGLENAHQGVDVMAYFPSTVIIHAGDTVHWKINSNEIHTVSFGYELNAALPEFIVPAALLGYPAVPSPLIANPAVIDPDVPAGLPTRASWAGKKASSRTLASPFPSRATTCTSAWSTAG